MLSEHTLPYHQIIIRFYTDKIGFLAPPLVPFLSHESTSLSAFSVLCGFPKTFPKALKFPQKYLSFSLTIFLGNTGLQEPLIFLYFRTMLHFPKTAFPKITMSWGKTDYPLRGKINYSLHPGRIMLLCLFLTIQNHSFIHKNA